MGVIRTPTIPVWQNSTTAVFFPGTRPLPFVRTVDVLWTMWFYGWKSTSTSGWPLRYRPAAQFSDDGLTWGTPIELGGGYIDPQADGEGSPDKWVYGDGYETLSGSSVARWVRYGAMVKRASGTPFVFGNFRLIVDTRE